MDMVKGVSGDPKDGMIDDIPADDDRGAGPATHGTAFHRFSLAKHF